MKAATSGFASHTGPGSWVPPVGAGLAVGATVVGLLAGGGAWSAPPAGLPDPGPLVGWGLPFLTVLIVGLGTLTLGWLGASVWLAQPDPRGRLTAAGRRDLATASRLAAAWLVASLLGWLFTVADIAGLPLAQALRPSVISTFGFTLATTNAYLIIAVIAAAICVGAVRTQDRAVINALAVTALVGVCVPAFGGHANAPGNQSLTLASALVHAAAAAIWIGGLAAFYTHIGRDSGQIRRNTQRFGKVALACVIALAISGVANAYTHLPEFGDLLASGYGQLVIVKTILLITLVAVAADIRLRVTPTLANRPSRERLASLITAELLLVAVTMGVGIALSQTPSP
jgi:putative copper export protein